MRKSLLRVVVSLSFIGLLFYLTRNDLPHIAETLSGADPGLVAGGIAAYAASCLILARRLQLIYEVQDTPISFQVAFHITFIGFFFNNFLPTAVGGDLVKAYCGSRITGERLKSFTSVLTDRLLGLFMFVLIPSCTVFFLMDRLDARVPIMIFGTLAAAVCGIAVLFNRRLARKFSFVKALLRRFNAEEKAVMLYDGLHHFQHHRGVIAHVSLLSAAGQLLSIGTVYIFIRALGADINPFYVLLLTPVVHLMSMLPSINGLGVREGSFVYFFKQFIGAPHATALAILFLFLLLIMSLIGGVIYLLRHEYHFRLREVVEQPKG